MMWLLASPEGCAGLLLAIMAIALLFGGWMADHEPGPARRPDAGRGRADLPPRQCAPVRLDPAPHLALLPRWPMPGDPVTPFAMSPVTLAELDEADVLLIRARLALA
jgi:hypothetical protein